MSYIEKAIKEAAKGGYDPNWNLKNVGEFPELKNRAFLDPQFWQCLGKARGWRVGQDSDEQVADEWWYVWHRFIDHLASGCDAESFFKKTLHTKE